ncbi:MAG: hypothetical protein AB7E76_14150 [Deferribacterales bacterium]
MRIKSLFICMLVVVVVAGCGGAAVQLNVPAKAEIKRETGNNTLREKIARIGKVNFLYASHPVEYINLSESKTAILTDEYWFPRVNMALRDICDGKQIAKQTVIDSFTGQQTVKEAPVDNTTRDWECSGGSIDFSISSIVTNSTSQASMGGVGSPKIMIMLESSYSGRPVLSENQAKMMAKYHTNVSLKDFLDSKFALIGGKAATHVRIQPDGAMYQEYFKKFSKVTDIETDLGILYDLNALCAGSGGFAAPIKGYNKSDIVYSLIPTDATFQCKSKTQPFFVRFQDLDGNKYAIYAKESVLNTTQLSDSVPQAIDNSNMSLNEMLASKLQAQIGAADLYKQKYVLAVSENNPVMSINDMNYVTEVHWIYRAGQCDQIAAVTMNTDTNAFDKIENYFRCGDSVKKLGDSSLPANLPGTLTSRVDNFLKTVDQTGSLHLTDVYSGVVIVGRKNENYRMKYIYFIKDNRLIYLLKK